MDKSKTCLLFLDLDGTLMFDGKISRANIEALDKVKALGHRVFINTGRSKGFIPPQVMDAFEWDGLVAGCSYAELGGEVILNEALSSKNITDVYSFCMDKGIFCLFEGVDAVYTVNHTYGIDITGKIDEFLKREASRRITKLTFGNARSGHNLKFDGLKILQMEAYAEGMLQGYSKATAMELICQKLGIEREQCIAFGDSENDVEMLKFAGTSVVMAHAPESLDYYATLRTKGEEDGVAQAIKELFLKA